MKNSEDFCDSTSDTDSGCCVMSIEDNDEAEEVTISTIPKDNIIRGSLLDLNHKSSEMSKQSVTIIRKGSLPLEKMKTNMKLFNSLTKSKGPKSSGYGKDIPRPKLFEPQINKSKPRPKKNNLFCEQSVSGIVGA